MAAPHVESAAGHLRALEDVLEGSGPRLIACSGGIDSLLLATVAHRRGPDLTVVAHTLTPAVPAEGTARVLAHARREHWHMELVRSREFDDERYLSNPTDRCYFCKTNLYQAVAELREARVGSAGATILSGANTDDLGEYRPGLIAAAEHGVRHPYVELGMGKGDIRAVARHIGLAEADLPASPCLASRLYTGTRVTVARLAAIELGEAVVRGAGVPIARCRIRGDDVLIEIPEQERDRVTEELLEQVSAAMHAALPTITSVELDHRPYRPGQAVLGVA